MQVDLLKPEELRATDIAEWNALVAADEFASPFLRPAWVLLMGRHRVETRVLRVSQNAGLVAYIAVEVHSRHASAVGAGLADRQGVAASVGFDVDVARAVRAAGLSTARFDHMAGDPLIMRPHVVRWRPSPLVDVSGGRGAHVAALTARGSSLPSSVRRKTRMTERELGPLRFVHDSDDRNHLMNLFETKSAQYRRTGAPDLFSNGWSRDVAEEVVHAREPEMTGCLSVLYAGDRPIAHHLGLRDGSVAHWWLPSYSADAGRYSPGLLLLTDFIRHCEEAGLQEIDLGLGEESYKQHVKSADRELAVVVVEAPGLRHAARAIRRRRRERSR